MSRARKIMISVRLHAGLVDRLDYVVRNTDECKATRSAGIQRAIELWLRSREEQLRKLGLELPK
jgi:metal-responsive CopG/Arc/MetJ family transcriptional regulator